MTSIGKKSEHIWADVQFNFTGKVALVTGSGRGIGKTIARALGMSGASVAVCDINREAGESTVEEFRAIGVYAVYFYADLSVGGGPQELVDKVVSQFGRLDILINNARAGKRANLSSESEDNWRLTMDVGVRAAFFAAQRAVQVMACCGGGSIVNMGSIAASVIGGESPSYHASKASLLNATKYLAVNAGGRNIRVNCILPGFIVQDEHIARYRQTDNADYQQRAERCHPIGRVGESLDVAAAVLFLCSDAAQFITGQGLTVDGGLMIQDPWLVASASR